MVTKFEMSAVEAATLERYWDNISDEQREAAEHIVPTLEAGALFEHGTVIERGNPPLLTVKRGEAVHASGSAEMMEYGAAEFEGEKFVAFNEPGLVVVSLRNHFVFASGHAAPYKDDVLSVHNVNGGFVDYENPMLDIHGDQEGSQPVMRLQAQPVLLG